jgi:riboflavin synthase
VDYVGRVAGITRHGADVSMGISLPKGYTSMVAEKCSIAVDGVSLTVAEAGRDSFAVCLIPHTLRSTTLGSRVRGDDVNVEFDIVGRYVARQKEAAAVSNITEEFLRAKGF